MKRLFANFWAPGRREGGKWEMMEIERERERERDICELPFRNMGFLFLKLLEDDFDSFHRHILV
jgi:hypothetical protein